MSVAPFYENAACLSFGEDDVVGVRPAASKGSSVGVARVVAPGEYKRQSTPGDHKVGALEMIVSVTGAHRIIEGQLRIRGCARNSDRGRGNNRWWRRCKNRESPGECCLLPIWIRD